MRFPRWLRWIGYALAALLAIVGGAWLALQSELGRALIAAEIERELSSDGIVASVDGIEGWLPAWPRIRKVTLADENGIFLTIQDVHITWRPLALIFGEIVIDDVSVGSADWRRLPTLRMKAQSTVRAPPPISIARLHVARIDVGRDVVGKPALLTLDASLNILDIVQRASLNATLIEDGSHNAKIEADIVYDWNAGILKTNVDAAEQPGGVFASLIGLPSDTPLSIKIASKGNLDDWQASLSGAGGKALKAEGNAAILRRGQWRELSLSLKSDIGDLGPESWRRLAKGATSIDIVAARNDAGSYRIDRLNVTSPALLADVTGTFDPATRRAEGHGQVAFGSARRFAPIIGDVADWRGLQLNARLQGEWPTPVLTIDAKAAEFTVSGVTSGDLTLRLQATPDRRWDADGLRVAITARARGDTAAASDPVIGDRLGATFTLAGRATLVDMSDLEALHIQLRTAAGSFDFAGSATSSRVAGTLSVNAPNLTHAGLKAGALSATLNVSSKLDGRGWTVRGKGSAENISTGSAIDGLLAGRYDVVVDAHGDSFDRVRISKFKLKGPKGAANAHGRINDGVADIVADAFIADLAAVSPDYAGRAEANVHIEGALDAPRLSGTATLTNGRLFGRPAKSLTLKLIGAGNIKESDFTIVGDLASKPIRGSTRLVWLDNGDIQLNDLHGAIASASLIGDATVTRNGLASGSIDVRASDLKDLSDVLGAELRGNGSARMRFEADGAQQNLIFAVNAPAFGFRATNLIGAVAQGRVTDLFGTRALDATARIAAASLDRLELTSIDARLKGPIDALSITAQAKRYGTDVIAAVVLKPGHTTIASVRTLQLVGPDNKAILAAPVDITIEKQRVTIPPTRLAIGGGSLTVAGVVGQTTNLEVRADAVPTWIAEIARSKPIPVTGSISGNARIGDGGVAVFDATIDRLALNSDAGPLRNLRASVSGRTDATGADLRLVLNGARGTSLQGSVRIPFSDTGPISAEIRGAVDLALANAFLSVGGDRAKGSVDLAVNVGGTLAAPSVSGRGRIVGGYWRSADVGFEIRNLAAEISASSTSITVTNLTGKAPNGGTISGQGIIRLDPRNRYPIDITLAANNAQLVSTELMTVVADANARITGGLLASPSVGGTVTVRSWEINIPRRLKPALTPIKVTHRNLPPGLAPQIAAEQNRPDKGISIGLDINVTAPRRVFVKGRGVDAEFGGSGKIAGTIDDPSVNGRFDLRRGTLSVLGRRVDLTRGVVTFDKDIEPTIDIAGEMRRNGVVATMTIKGKASEPTLALTSTPELPESEVLARLLFNKSGQQLSAVEAAQLAAALGDWTGPTGGTSIFDRVSKALGGGTYAGNNVYFGADPISGRATIDFDLWDRLKLRGEVSPSGDTRVGVAAEWEY